MPADSSATLVADPGSRIRGLQQGPTAHTTYRLIQVLRAIAAEMVVLFHTTTLLQYRDSRNFSTWTNGATGVDIFFVISGFVMMISTTPLLRSPHPARTFFARRIERIAPMYWLAITAKVLALLAIPTLAIVGLGHWWHVLASYLFIPTSSPIGVYSSILAVGWTLIFEMFFYVLFAIVLSTRLPRLPTLAPVLVALAFAWTIPFIARHGMLRFYANTMQLEFLFGMLLAASIDRVRKLPSSLAILLAIAGFLTLLLWNSPANVRWGGIRWGVPALAVVMAAVALESSFGPRTPRWLLEIGDASYSIYLVHGFVVPGICIVFAHYISHGPYSLPFALIAAIGISTLAGDLVYRLIERPIIQWFKGRRRPAIPALADRTAPRGVR